MNQIEEIITIISAALGLIITITGFWIPLIKSTKAKKSLIAVNKLTGALQNMVIEAEKFVNYSGEEKKQYVMTKAYKYAVENKIPYDENAVSEKIEDLVALSKQVNVKTATQPKEVVADSNKIISVKFQNS